MNSRENETASNDSAVIQEPLSVSGWRAIALPHDHNDGTTHRWAVRYTKVGGPFDGVTVQIADWLDEESAHLVSAAPEMLEALRELLAIVTEHDKLQYPKGSPIDRTITRARQIIAKAEGKP